MYISKDKDAHGHQYLPFLSKVSERAGTGDERRRSFREETRGHKCSTFYPFEKVLGIHSGAWGKRNKTVERKNSVSRAGTRHRSATQHRVPGRANCGLRGQATLCKRFLPSKDHRRRVAYDRQAFIHRQKLPGPSGMPERCGDREDGTAFRSQHHHLSTHHQ